MMAPREWFSIQCHREARRAAAIQPLVWPGVLSLSKQRAGLLHLPPRRDPRNDRQYHYLSESDQCPVRIGVAPADVGWLDQRR